jgi:predicted N-acetyltransferase YhbS
LIDADAFAHEQRFGADREFRIVPARPGDHHAIHCLLVSILRRPSSSEFQAQLEDPFYEPTDRLVVKRGEQVVAHSRVWNREMHFGDRILPISTLSDLAVLPEYRNEDCASELLRAAERSMLAGGAKMAFLSTQDPEFFAARGWVRCGRHSHSIAGARDILSRLQERQASPHDPLSPPDEPLNIRMWRHVEQAALMRLYAECTRDAFGPLVRSEAYWRWLISRRAYDRIYIAINGPDKLELDDTLTPIVGYAVMREGQILELVTTPDHSDAAEQLLARACGDSIEQDLHYVRLDAAPDFPLHDTFAAAGGRRCNSEVDNNEVMMTKLFDPLGFLEDSFAEIHRRAKAAGLALPFDFGLLIDDERLAISVRQRSVKLLPGKLGRSYLECGVGEFTQLLLGHLDIEAAVELEAIRASTRTAIDAARVLFPRLPIWRPAFDSTPA